MDKDTQFMLLVIGLPILGLIYAGIGILVMINSVWVREHSLISGTLFFLIPATLGGVNWMISFQKKN
jgi:hypothetical protein